jgi:ABC-type multidrug transport system ATPase subunit
VSQNGRSNSVDLTVKRDELVTSLSRGMTQRLGLARVLLHDPQVLLLDEPGQWPRSPARIEMRGLLKRLQGLGKTILVSSHILPELADICNRVGIIEYGRLLACGDVGDLLAAGPRPPRHSDPRRRPTRKRRRRWSRRVQKRTRSPSATARCS